MSKSPCRPLQIPFYRGFVENQKEPGTNFQLTFFIESFDKNVSFVILHKLAKFHYQTMFTTNVIQINVFCVSCLRIWWRHDIWISEKLSIEYLKIWLSQERKELSKGRAFPLFGKWSPLDLTNYQKYSGHNL